MYSELSKSLPIKWLIRFSILLVFFFFFFLKHLCISCWFVVIDGSCFQVFYEAAEPQDLNLALKMCGTLVKGSFLRSDSVLNNPSSSMSRDASALLRVSLKLLGTFSVCFLLLCFSGADLELTQCLQCLGLIICPPFCLFLASLGSLKEVIFWSGVRSFLLRQ